MDADAVLGPVEEISPPMIVAGSMMPCPPTLPSRRRAEAQTRAGKPCADSGQVIRDVDIDKTWANRLWLSPRLAFDTADGLGRGRLDGQVWTAKDRILEVCDDGPGATA